MKCGKCGSKMHEKQGEYLYGVPYNYWSCPNCGDEIVDMRQLHEAAEKTRKLKQYSATVSQWGDSIAIRIPRELANQYHLKPKKTVSLVPEKKAIKILAP